MWIPLQLNKQRPLQLNFLPALEHKVKWGEKKKKTSSKAAVENNLPCVFPPLSLQALPGSFLPH